MRDGQEVAEVEPFGGKRWRGGRRPKRYGWDTKQAVADAAGVTLHAVERAVERGQLVLGSLRSVAAWVVRVRPRRRVPVAG